MPIIRFDDATSRTLFWVIAGSILLVGGMVIAPFIPAILWAAILSVLMYPYFQRLVSNKWKPAVAAGWVTLLTLLIVVLPIMGFATAAYLEIAKAFQSGQSNGASGGELSIKSVSVEIDRQLEPLLGGVTIPAVRDFRLETFLQENEDEIRTAAVGPATEGAKKLAMTLGTSVIALLTMFFMLKDGHKLRDPALCLIPLPRDEAIQILNRLRETVFSVFTGVVFVALIQGAVGGLAYWICGVPGALIWACATFIFAMIPMVGPPVVFVPIAISLYLSGKPGYALGLVLFGALILTQIDNVLRPFFIGAKASLHPITVFFSLLGGVIYFGPVGLMVGPITLTLVMAVAEVLIARRRLLDEETKARNSEPAAPAVGI